MRRLMSIVLSVIAVYAGFLACLFLFQRTLLYHPSGDRPDPAAFGVPDMAQISVETSDGLNLFAWYKPADADRQTILYLHGNGGHIGYRGGKVRAYLDAGYGVLLLSYRGYAGNPGKPTEEGLYRDGEAAMAFLAGQGVQSSQVVLYGESLGTGIAIQLATQHKVNAVVLEAPYSSIPDVAQHHYFYMPVRYLVRDRFDSTEKITRVEEPILVVHGVKDRVVPMKFGKKLFEAAREPKTFLQLDAAGHNDLYDFGVAAKVIDFMRKYH